MKKTIAMFISLLLLVSVVQAGVPVQVTINGEVEFNQVNPANSRLGNASSGDPAVISFLLDSDTFEDNMNFPTRAYQMDQSSFSLTLGPETVGLENPYTSGFVAPSFILRNDDPAVDGFFISDNPNIPDPLETEEPGVFGQFGIRASVTYGNDPLSSLDILDAQGTYDFTGLTVFGMAVVDGPAEPIGMIFSDMTISAVPEPSSIALLGLCVFFASIRRHR